MPSSQVAYTNLPTQSRLSNTQEPKVVSTTTTTNITDQSIQAQILHELRQLNRTQVELASETPLRSQALWTFILQFFGVVVGMLFGVFAILAWKAADKANAMSDQANTLASQANDIAAKANNLAMIANKLALAGYCQLTTNAVCASIQAAAATSAVDYAASLYGVTVLPEITATLTRASYVWSTTVVTLGTITSTSYVTVSTSLYTVTTTSRYSASSGQATASPSFSVGQPAADGRASAGPIAGIVLGVIAGASIVGAAAWSQFLVYKRKLQQSRRMKELAQTYDEKLERYDATHERS